MADIENYSVYLGSMKKAMADKAWFMDWVPELTANSSALIFDYGCADCALGRFLVDEKQFTGTYIGIDANPEMEKAATIANKPEQYGKIHWSCGNFCYTNTRNFPEPNQTNRATLVLNSVIHEVYSYGMQPDIHHFWDNVWYRGWKRIAIRDMALSRIDADNVALGIQWAAQMPLEFFGRYRLWQQEYGGQRLDSTEDIAYYLLKYRYIENWERESKECYFPLYWEELLCKIPSNYRIVYAKHYCLPYIRETVANDTGIDLDIPTHYQLLLEKT